jgi:adenine/guanine phosphoribosyltransferase-like PRPP-binding protein
MNTQKVLFKISDIKDEKIENKIINIFLETPTDTIYKIISINEENYMEIEEENLLKLYKVFPSLKDKKLIFVKNEKIELKTGTLKLKETNDLKELTGYGSRINPKRGYLFVSKVLGKHIPVKPHKMKEIYTKLANKIKPHINLLKPTIVIGFAETSTALGQGVFEELDIKNSFYIHSTRYTLNKEKLFEFYEEHCHAPSHVFYKPEDKQMLKIINEAFNIILIDDEVTTGKTANNMINELKKILPTAENFILGTILNWTKEEFENYEIISLYKDSFTFEENKNFKTNEIYQSIPKSISYLDEEKVLIKNYGRLGIRKIDYSKIFEKQIEKEKYKNKKILVLGTSEFMYIPYLLAKYMEQQGIEVYYQVTTRSPANIDRDIESRILFKDNYFENIDNFLYNIENKNYDNVIICLETNKIPNEFDLKNKLENLNYKVEIMNYANI